MVHVAQEPTRSGSSLELAIRVLAAALGVGLFLVAGYYFAGELTHLRLVGLSAFTVRDAAASLGILALVFAGALLVAFFPVPRGVHLPRWTPGTPAKPVYGFGTILAIGVGSTLGSPLFLLIPLNVIQYEIVSIISLVAATVLSVAMAKNNAYSYRVLKTNGLDAVGGPAFVRVALGTRSARYFVSRLSMAVANATLAAYCILVFVLFTFGFLPTLLEGFGLAGLPTFLLVVAILVLFGVWFVMNSILETRFIRVIGWTQIVFTSVLVAILVGQSYLLGSSGGWNVRGLLAFPATSPLGWIGAVIVNTGYLYLLFFGFQEIQALDREARETARVPLLWRLGRRFELDKSTYVGIAMVASVIIAAAVNIFYALAVYVSNPSSSAMSAAQIPGLYVVEAILGSTQTSLAAIAFMIAAFTTFVPAFMAASRHIVALGEDGFLPKGVGKVSWLLVLVSIAFLAAAGEGFLVSITDFMVLVSLGLIALAAIWLRRNRRKVLEWTDALAVAVGSTCFLAAGVLYGVTPSVAVFGSLSIAIAFLIYDVIELGTLGSRLFVAILCLVCYGLLVLYPTRLPSPGLLPFPALEEAVRTTAVLRTGLLVAAVGLLALVLATFLRPWLHPQGAGTTPNGGRRIG